MTDDNEKSDLAAILYEAIRLQQAGDNQGCLDLCRRYILLRRNHPSPQMEVIGRTWDGDHVMKTYNTQALIGRDGIMAFPD